MAPSPLPSRPHRAPMPRWRRLPAGAAALWLGLAAAPAAAQPTALPESYARVATWPAAPQPRPLGELTAPEGIDVDGDGMVYVADSAEGVVHVLMSTGQGVRRIGAPGREAGQLDAPSDVEVDGGRVFVADAGNRRLQVFDAAGGRFLAEWRLGYRPVGIAAGGGRVYVSDAAAPRVTVYDTAGVALAVWGQGQGVDAVLPFVAPRGMAVDDEGDVFVADPGRADGPLLEVSAEGALKRTLAAVAGGLRNRPLDVAVAGTTPFTISFEEIVTYRSFFLTVSPVRFDGLNGGRGIAVGPGDGLVATVQDSWAIASQVVHYADRSAGRATATWGDLPAAVGTLPGPRRVAATADGGAYLADAWPRVQRWGPGGVPLRQVRADGAVDVARGPGDGVYVVAGDGVTARGADGAVRWSWSGNRSGTWLTAAASDGAVLTVADVGRGRLLRFDPGGTAPGGQRGPAVDVPLAGLIVDVAASGAQVLVADRGVQALRVLDASTGAETARWAFPGRVVRVAAGAATGGWFVLTADGWVRKYDAGGGLRAAWDAAPDGTPVDLDVNPAGAVLVVDGRGGRVLVYAPVGGGSADVPPVGNRCDVVPAKTAAPARVRAGDAVTVTLAVDGDCPSEPVDLDVVLVIDQSGSMAGPKIAAARGAAASFTAELDFRRVQAGVVLFASSADVAQTLTGDAGAVIRAAAAAQARGGTNIADGLRAARGELASGRARPGAQKAIVLMTDGLPEDADGARREAATARQAGIALFAIGLGGDVDGGLLTELAGAADRYFEAPTEVELARVYARIARRLVTGTLLRSIEVVDVLPANMVLEPGSAAPPAAWDAAARTLRWTLADVPPAGFRLTYRVRPAQAGVWPTNVRAAGDYLDGVGQAGKAVFPVPRVEVVGNRALYLPILFQRRCPALKSDVVLVIDTSSSMDGATGAGGDTKLDAARRAARAFVGFLGLPADRAAVVAFNDGAALVQGLTGDRGAVERALDALPRASGTRIDLGLEKAFEELSGPRRNGANLPIVVLLTDGRPSGGSEAAALAAAAALRSRGVAIFGIGLGADADGGLLVEIAGSAARYSYAPDGAALQAIYQTIAWSLPCGDG